MQIHALIKLFIVLIGLAVAFDIQAATVAMRFYDANGQQVGYGQFSYDPNKKTCVEIEELGNCDNNPSVPDEWGMTQYDYHYVVDKENVLTSFYATIQGQKWGIEEQSIKTWWSPAGHSFYHHRLYISENDWFFGDGFMGTRQLSFYMNSSSGTSGNGTWSQRIVNVSPSIEGSGTWTASVVPLPAAFWLFLSGLGMMARICHKKPSLN